MRRRILIVDDDVAYAKELGNALSIGYDVELAVSIPEFHKKYRIYYYDLIVLDMRLERDKEGLELLRQIVEEDPLQPVIIITAYGTTDLHAEALEAGALLFLKKQDFDIPALVKMVEILMEHGALKRRLEQIEKRLGKPTDIIGNSPAIREVKKKIRIAAEDGRITVLIRGESGTGKELVAQNIHKIGIRRNGPFKVVLISAFNKETLYSDLFGHERGSFTGAVSTRKGLIEEAHKGVLFLDEIGDLDPESQIKLLRVLETRRFTRLGGNREITVDVQFVTATNRDLESLIQEGRFREDLYYRLKAFEIYVPPLRERKEDIPLLAMYFLKLMYKEGRTSATHIDKRVMEIFMRYPWPGNVRELRYTVEYAGLQAKMQGESVIKPFHLPRIHNEIETEEPEPTEKDTTDYKKYLAMAELELIERTIAEKGIKRKKELATVLQYPNRFTFTRRIRGLLMKYPELRERFPKVSKLFSQNVRKM